MKISPCKLRMTILLVASCLAFNAGAQQLLNTSWRAVGQIGQTFKAQGFDTMTWQFLPGNRLHWVGEPATTSSTIYSLWWPTGAQGFKFNFQDTTANTSLLSSLCPAADTTYVKGYHISGDTLHVDSVMGGCSVVTSILVGSTWKRAGTLGLPGVAAGAEAITIYPQPATASAYLNTAGYFAASARLTLSLYDNIGRKIKSFSASPGRIPLDGLGTLPDGMYVLRVVSDGGQVVVKKITIGR